MASKFKAQILFNGEVLSECENFTWDGTFKQKNGEHVFWVYIVYPDNFIKAKPYIGVTRITDLTVEQAQALLPLNIGGKVYEVIATTIKQAIKLSKLKVK